MAQRREAWKTWTAGEPDDLSDTTNSDSDGATVRHPGPGARAIMPQEGAQWAMQALPRSRSSR